MINSTLLSAATARSGMGGNYRHKRALAGELDACVERLVAKGRADPARKYKRRSREVNSSPRRSQEVRCQSSWLYPRSSRSSWPSWEEVW